jgi:hypothetical protein
MLRKWSIDWPEPRSEVECKGDTIQPLGRREQRKRGELPSRFCGPPGGVGAGKPLAELTYVFRIWAERANKKKNREASQGARVGQGKKFKTKMSCVSGVIPGRRRSRHHKSNSQWRETRSPWAPTRIPAAVGLRERIKKGLR